MQSLADALKNGGFRPRFMSDVKPNHLDPEDVENRVIEDLRNYRPTHEVQSELDTVRDELDFFRNLGDEEQLPWYRNRVGVLETELRWSEKRDELAEGRSPKCWCLGTGGRIPTGTNATLDPPSHTVWRITCPGCEEGAEAEKRRLAALAYSESATGGRRDRRISILAQADVPAHYQGASFDTFPVTDNTQDALNRIRAWSKALAESERVKRSIYLYGPLGAGKTTLACAVLGEWKERTHAIGLFTTASALMDAIRSARESREKGNSQEGLMEGIGTHPFVVLDDLGAEKETAWVAERLLRIVNDRHNQDRITIITSNLSIGSLAAQLAAESSDPLTAERIAWRLTEMCEVISMYGPNLRDPSELEQMGVAPLLRPVDAPASDSTNSSV